MGMSFGGFLAPRAAASEHRVAALIACDGLCSFADAWYRLVGPEVMKLVGDCLAESDSKANALMEEIMNSRTQTFGPALPWGMWVLGADSMAALLRAVAPDILEGYAPLITCPTLVLDGEMTPGTRPSSMRFFAARRRTTFFPAADGRGEHCQEGVTSRFHQVVFDWLDTVLTTRNAASSIS